MTSQHEELVSQATFYKPPGRRENRDSYAIGVEIAICVIILFGYYFASPEKYGEFLNIMDPGNELIIVPTFCLDLFAIIVLSYLVAEFLRRLALYWEESHHLDTRYNGRRWKALMASLSFSRREGIIYLITAALCIFIIVWLSNSYAVYFLVVLPCFCIFYFFLHLIGKMQPCDTDLQRLDPKQISFGQVFAWQLYIGYLKIILPSFLERIKEYEDENNIKIRVHKLFILLPESCYTPTLLDKHYADRNNIQYVKSLREVKEDRNGIKNRVYTNPVYRIVTTHEVIYCCVEGAAIFSSLYNMNKEEKITGVTDEILQQARVEFHAQMQSILNDDPLGYLVELVSYKDIDEKDNQVKISTVISQRIGHIIQRTQQVP